MVKVMITGIGSPGAYEVIQCLKEYKELELYGVDADADAACKNYVHFFKVPRADKYEKRFIEKIEYFVKMKGIKVILPLVTAELKPLAKIKDYLEVKYNCKVMVNDGTALKIMNDKPLLLQAWEVQGNPVAKFGFFNSKDRGEQELREHMIGYDKVVVKLPVSNGSRGFRVITKNKPYRELFKLKPEEDVYITDKEFFDHIFTEGQRYLFMEYLPGKEWTVDCLCDKGEIVSIVPRVRNKIRSGITFEATFQWNDEIIKQCERFIKAYNIDHVVGFQFKENADGEPRLLECNPRVQGSMPMSELHGGRIIYNGILKALGDEYYSNRYNNK